MYEKTKHTQQQLLPPSTNNHSLSLRHKTSSSSINRVSVLTESFLPSPKMAQHLKSSSSRSTLLNVLRHNLGLGSPSHASRHLRHNLPHNPPSTRVSPNPLTRLCNTMVDTLSSTSSHEDANSQVMDFPGGKVAFTPEIHFISESNEQRVPCYRVLDDNGQQLTDSRFVPVSEEVAVKMYSDMVTLQMMDNIFYEAQRQGRLSFYATAFGEEAINIASAAALSPQDVIFPQYREPGVLLWRGFTLQEFANQCFGNKSDYGKGRQMPVHYGSNKLNYFTVSATIATQLPNAVGAAYSLKMDGKEACAVTFFGDGGSSEGDFHAALNFAAVMEAPVLFICRNNGWAISTPTSDQFRSDGVVVKGRAYGIRSIRVDGNDALAMYSAVHEGREMAIREHRPILIEALTYRVGHHSTSDDSTRYRSADEIEWWNKARNPLSRFRTWVESNGWWSDEAESDLRSRIKKEMLEAIRVAEKTEKPNLNHMFSDVYDVPPLNLREQELLVRKCVKSHPQDYPSDVPL